ncbi:hypothetical protein STENM327S_02882 [Streptomyces tendae]
MASTDTTRPAGDRGAKDGGDLAGLEAGLDALESVQPGRTPLRQTLVEKVLPPALAVLLVLAVWQALVSFEIVDDPTKLPAPSDSSRLAGATSSSAVGAGARPARVC